MICHILVSRDRACSTFLKSWTKHNVKNLTDFIHIRISSVQFGLPQLSDIVTECLNTWKWQAQSTYLPQLLLRGSRVYVSTLWPGFCLIQSMDRIKSPLQTDRKSVCLYMFSCIYFDVKILTYLILPHWKIKKFLYSDVTCITPLYICPENTAILIYYHNFRLRTT